MAWHGWVDVAALRASGEVVRLSRLTAQHDAAKAAREVCHVHPVAHVVAASYTGSFRPASADSTICGMSFSGYWRGPYVLDA